MPILGRTVEQLVVRLIPNDPFVCEIVRDDATTWPAPPLLEFSTTPGGVTAVTWTATTTAATARFDQADTTVQAVIDAGLTGVRLTVGGVLWWAGTVEVSRRA